MQAAILPPNEGAKIPLVYAMNIVMDEMARVALPLGKIDELAREFVAIQLLRSHQAEMWADERRKGVFYGASQCAHCSRWQVQLLRKNHLNKTWFDSLSQQGAI